MDTISRSAANSPVLSTRAPERVRPVPHSAKDRLERHGEEHGQSRKDAQRDRTPEAAPDPAADSPPAPVVSGTPLSPPPPVRPPPAPGTAADSLEDGVEAIRRLMTERDPKVDLQR